jgi:O-antigen/teichoic acid export membrane protein
MKYSLSINALSVIASRLAVPCLNVLLVAALARLGGAESLGQYTLLVTLFVLCENLKSCGLTTLLTREVAAAQNSGLNCYASVVRIGLFGSVPAAAFMLAILAISKAPADAMLAGGILATALIPSSFVLAGDAVLLGIGGAHWSMFLAIGENIARLVAACAWVLLFHGGLIGLAVIYAIGRLAAACIQRVVIRRFVAAMPPHDFHLTLRLLRQAGPFFVVFAAPLLLFKLDVILIGAFRGDAAVGLYSAAMRLVAIWLVIPDGLMTATLVRLAHCYAQNEEDQFRLLVYRTVRFLNAVMLPLGAATALLGRDLVQAVFGNRLESSLPLLDVLSWTIVPYALCRTLGDTLVATNRQNTLARIILIALGLSITWYVALIRYAAETGAAWAFLLSTVTLGALTAWKVATKFHIVSVAVFWRGLAPSLLGLAATLVYRAGNHLVSTVLFLLLACLVLNGLLEEGKLWRQSRRITSPSALPTLNLESAK